MAWLWLVNFEEVWAKGDQPMLPRAVIYILLGDDVSERVGGQGSVPT